MDKPKKGAQEFTLEYMQQKYRGKRIIEVGFVYDKPTIKLDDGTMIVVTEQWR